MEQEHRHYAHPITRAFLVTAVEERAHLVVPQGVKPERWAIRREILCRYYLGAASDEQIGALYPHNDVPLTRERIRQIRTACLERIHSNCSPETQKKFPFGEIPKSKPASLGLSIDRMRSKNNLTSQILSRVEDGKDARSIMQELDLTSTKLSSRRYWFQERQVQIPRLNRSPQQAQEIINGLKDPELDPENLQRILNQVNRSFIQYYREQIKGILISITELMGEAGLNSKNSIGASKAVKQLIEAGVMVRTISSGTKKGRDYHSHYIPHQQKAKALAELLAQAHT